MGLSQKRICVQHVPRIDTDKNSDSKIERFEVVFV